MPRIRLAFVFAAALVLAATAAHAQTLTNIYNYDFPSGGATGANPYGNLIQASDGNLYGTGLSGGANNGPTSNYGGVIFKIVPTTGALTVIYSCNDAGTDCNGPDGLLELPDGNLYGTANQGCTYGYGCIFSISMTGGNYTILHAFSNSVDGEYPNGFNIFDGANGTIYGCNSGDGVAGDADAYGNCWAYTPDLGVGFSLYTGLLGFTVDGPDGYQPVAGVTVINGNFYSTTQLGGSAGNGTLFYYNESSNVVTELENFGGGTPGSFPSVTPKLYSDNNIYGTSLSNYPAGNPNNGAVWKSGLTSGFTVMYDFNTPVGNSPIDPITFDTAGNILFIAEGDRQDYSTSSGQSNFGELYLEPHAGGTVDTLYTFTQNTAEGDTPLGQPFFDNRGHLWTIQLTGGGNEIGSIDEWTLSTETKAPISITASPAVLAPNSTSTIKWSTNNSFSDNEKYCFGMGNGDTGWDGVQQTGTYASGVLSGTYSAKPTAAGTYVYSIVCGSSESANVSLTVEAVSATTTTVTATPNPVGQGGNVTLTATVKRTAGGTVPTGMVTFKSGTTVLNTVAVNASGVASFTASTSGFSKGTYPVTATYSGDAVDTASTSSSINVVVNTATTTTLTASPNPVPAGGTVTLTATVSPSAATGNVTFKTGTTTLATVALSGGVAKLVASTSAYPAGTYPVVATYAGNSSDAGSTSPTVNVVLQ